MKLYRRTNKIKKWKQIHILAGKTFFVKTFLKL